MARSLESPDQKAGFIRPSKLKYLLPAVLDQGKPGSGTPPTDIHPLAPCGPAGKMKSKISRLPGLPILWAFLASGLMTTSSMSMDTVVVFNEIHYHPANGQESLEFVELYNQHSVDIDISGWQISGGIDFTFPGQTVINADSYLVVAADPDALKANTQASEVLGPFSGKLSNGGETLLLLNNNRRVMDEVDYNDRPPWPSAPDGSGLSLSKIRPHSISALPANWTKSRDLSGSPGRINFPPPDAPPPTVKIPLVALDSLWRYNESGTDLGADWAKQEHEIRGDWKSGIGVLARETGLDEPIGTELTRPFLNDPYVITYYFETGFNLTQEDLQGIEALELSFLIDDGAIFYINGEEVYRYNMPAGSTDAATLASAAAEAQLRAPLNIPSWSLSPGENRISVEVHQSKLGSSDVVMGARLNLVRQASPSESSLSLNELGSSDEDDWWFELLNTGSSPIDLAGYRLVINGNAARSHLFADGKLDPGSLMTSSSSATGLYPENGDSLFLFSPGGFPVDNAIVGKRPRGRLPNEPLGTFYTPESITPGAENTFSFQQDIIINEVMYHHRPQYAKAGDPPTFSTRLLSGWDATWRYNEEGDNLGTSWAATAHAIGGNWQQGTGPLGYETSAGRIPVPISTTLRNPSSNAPRVTTYYFETEFELDGDSLSEITQLHFSHLTDDGAIYYLNGQEVSRYDMPDGVVTSATFAVNNTATEADAIRSFTVDPGFLVAGTNRISVEVHQASANSSDVVMGLKLEAWQEVLGPSPSVPFRENPEEWIELYNRSAKVVDLSGWKLDGAISFTFEEGMQIAGNGYLVIARDAASLAGKFPGIEIAGNFSGQLSNRGERILLLDAQQNPADEVLYFDDNPWPGQADGGGSSLELRHPDIDNAIASSWAASNNRQTSEWQDYSFTLTARDPTYRPGQFNFHELRIGMLEAGEILIDDLSVLEAPGGAAIELIANGTFENSIGWRRLGTHKQSRVTSDNGRNVLKIAASDKFNYLNNLIETNLTLNGGALRPVQNGQEYRVSFRAKWLSGSPQLRFELYYNKLASLVILNQSAKSGTPGRQNSTYSASLGPGLSGLIHHPAVPSPGESITVNVKATDPDGLSTMVLRYAVNGADFRSLPMARSGRDLWSAVIPGQSSSSRLQFYVEARDGSPSGNLSYAPPGGPESRAIIVVSTPNTGGLRQSVRINMLSSEANAMHNANDILSNHRFGCTLITDEQNIAYDAGIRLRGSMFSRSSSSNGALNLKFPADRRYRGAHSTITVRRGNRREILVKHIVNAAGGIHDNYNDIIHLNGHIPAQFGRARMEMSRFGNIYLKSLPGGDGAEGTVFKMEGIRQFEATQDGSPNTPKKPFPIGWIRNFDIADQGDDKEIYRNNMRINTSQARDDYSGVIRMCKLLSMNGQELEDLAPSVLDVDRWTRQFAMLSLCGIGDTYSQGNPHNLNFYSRPDGLVEPMPWDWDFTFNRSTSSSLWGNRNIAKVFARPVYTRMFHGHLHDIITTTYNAGYLTRWFNHLGSVSGENYAGNISYVNSRASYVLSQLPTRIAFSITSNGGEAFSVNQPTATLTGDGWINVREIFIEGADVPLEASWTDANTWQATVPLQPGPNEFKILAFNHRGEEVGQDTITVTNTGANAPASASNLAISEIMYHPLDTGREFIELLNLSNTETIVLSDIRFINGIEYTFPPGSSLGPGGRVVVYQGQFANSTRLSNSGERITLVDASGLIIQDFSYNDGNPWPESADGRGFSLVRISPQDDVDLNLGAQWRPSVTEGGNPARSDSVPFAGNSPEEIIDHALPLAGKRIKAQVDREGKLNIAIRRKLASDDVEFDFDYSIDLGTWQQITPRTDVKIIERDNHGDGTETLVLQTGGISPADGNKTMAVRVRIKLR